MLRTERRSHNKSRIRILTALSCWLLGVMLFPLSHSLRPTAALVLRRNIQGLRVRNYHQRTVLSSLQQNTQLLSRSNQPRTKRWRVSLSSSITTASVEEELSNTTVPVMEKEESTSPEHEYIQELTKSWRDHPDLSPTFCFPGWFLFPASPFKRY
jgi:hypothetical protein